MENTGIEFESFDAMEAFLRQGREEHRAQVLSTGGYEAYLACFGGHEKLAPFLEVAKDLVDAQYWRLLADAWSNIEASFPDREVWLELFQSPRGDRECLMTRQEHKKLAKLPAQIQLYRGYAGNLAERGLSWTLLKTRAVFFGKVYATGSRRAAFDFDARGQAPTLATGWCHKRDVLAYFAGRKEAEIVIHPNKVFDVTSVRL